MLIVFIYYTTVKRGGTQQYNVIAHQLKINMEKVTRVENTFSISKANMHGNYKYDVMVPVLLIHLLLET